MRYRKIFDMILSTVEAWIENRGPSRGAALAFYTLFSISPILIIMTSIASFFLGDETVRNTVIDQSRIMVGDEGAKVVKSILQHGPNRASNFFAGFVGLVMMLIGSTSVFAELKNTLDQIWRAETKWDEGIWNFVKTRLLSLAITLTMTLLIIVSVVFSAFAHKIVVLSGGFISEYTSLLEALNFLFMFILTTGLFATIYKVLPSAKIEWKDVWVGAAITSVLFTIGKTLIGFYLLYSATASVFGAAGSLIVLLFWMYYSAQVFLLGAEFTKFYAGYFASRPRD